MILETLIVNIVPLYILIALGYGAGRWLDVNLPSITAVAVYILAPVVEFGAMVKLDLRPEYLALTPVVFILAVLIGSVFYKVAQAAWLDNNANLIGMSAMAGNTGYFGLPLVLALFGPEWAGVYLLMDLGIGLALFGPGYYIGARGHGNMRTALAKVLKLPFLYAIALGLAANTAEYKPPEVFTRYWEYAIGAWVILGMMLIGVALSKQKRLKSDWRLLRWMFAAKFLAWPACALAFVAADALVFRAFGPTVYSLFVILSCVPMAASTVTLAANLRLHPERTAAAVLISTLCAIVYMPAIFWLADFGW